ncbi:hypothetical protein AAG570_014155 [Ranatra chinensis]|uniref:Nucleic-acid-binding protein from transposon X-element n=1 Tax=Ranatra chinensis TaxID=642074 RepID=A0ABD0XRW0_9HEMI
MGQISQFRKGNGVAHLNSTPACLGYPVWDLQYHITTLSHRSSSWEVSALASAPEELEVRSKERVPPIVVNGTINDVKSFLASCQRVTKTRVTIKNTGRTTQVFAASKEDHTALRELFVKNNLLYHTYAFKGERRKKWVIHGLTASAPVGEILEDVRQTIPGAVQVIQMTKTDGDGRKRVLPTFILITNAGVTQKEFKNLVIYSHYVQVQKYTTEEAVTQCYRCQLFGHSSRYCNLQQKCVRCAGNHRASECDREKIKPKCANCNEAHVASYKTCQARTRYVESKESKRKKETYNIPPIYHAPPDLRPRNPGDWRRTTERTYAQVTAPPPPPSQEDTFGIMGELQNLGKEVKALNIGNLLKILKDLVRDLKNTDSGMGRIEVLLKYASMLEP